MRRRTTPQGCYTSTALANSTYNLAVCLKVKASSPIFETPMRMGPTICVYCRNQATVAEWQPFCSERCKQLDLRNWVDGRYRVPGEATTIPDDDDGERRD